MTWKGYKTKQAINVLIALGVYSQGQMEAAAVTMTERLYRMQETRSDIVVAFMTKLTGKMMIGMQAGVMAYLETLPSRLGEEL